MSAEIVELIIQAKDLASEAIIRLQSAMETLPQKEEAINAKLNQTRLKANEFVAKLTNDRIKLAEVEKERNLRTLYDYYKSGIISAEQYSASVKAINAKAIASAAEPSLLENIKSNWIALTATIIAAWQGVSKALEYIDIGAKALQAEASFSSVTTAMDIDGAKLLAKMKEVSIGMIDESALMHRAVAALQQGLNPDQIVSLLEVARVQARESGKDMIEVFDGITQAATTQMTKGLKAYQLVIDQNKAYEDQANLLGIAKEALNEQQQSQAIANAVIEEGARHMKTFKIETVDAAEKIQQHKRAIEEMKESIGKGLIQALGLAVENIDGIAAALVAAAIINAPAMFARIAVSLEALTASAGAASIGLKSMGVGLAAFLGWEVGSALAKIIYDFDEIEKRTIKLTADLDKNTKTLNSELALLGFTGKDAWEKYEIALKAGMIVTDQATGKTYNLLENLKQSITLMQAQIQSLQATQQYYGELVKRDYETGKITMEQYLEFIQKSQKKITDAQIDEAKKRIEETQKEYQMKMISEDEMKNRIAVITEQIAQLKIKGIHDYQNASDQLNKESTDKAKKAEEDKFEAWKSLEDLKLDAMKRQLALEDILDEEALKKGEIRQSEFLERKLQRLKDSYGAEISLAEEAVKKIQAENDAKITLSDADIVKFERAVSDKEKLQDELKVNIIKSESEIAQAREAEDQKAIEAKKKYYEEMEALDKEDTARFIKELHERTEQLNIAVAIVTERRQRLENAVSSMFTNSFEDVKHYFGDVKEALSTDLKDVEYQIDQFMKHTTMVGYDTFWNASLFGRRLIEMTGTTIYEWAQRVSDYINYIKSLVQSLEQYIMSLRMQLAQLRGDRMAELEMWYAEEKQKVEDQYKDLKDTQEYYDALALLLELYKEKKKKILDEMAADEEASKEKTGESSASGGGLSGNSGGMAVPVPASFQSMKDEITKGMQGIAESMKLMISADLNGLIPREMTVSRTLDASIRLELPAIDKDNMRRVFEDDFWPLLQRKFELMGIKI
jgi:hypothetical protein